MTGKNNYDQRLRSVLAGILGGSAGRFLVLIVPFLVMPKMLEYLGPAGFGIWMTALSITSMSIFADLGIGNGLLTRLSKAHGENNSKEMKSYISSAYVTLGLMSLGLLTILIAFLLFLFTSQSGLIDVFQGRPNAWIFSAVIFLFILNIPIGIVQKVMYARQHILLSNLWQIIGSVFAIICCFIAIDLKLPGWMVVISYTFPQLLVTLLSTYFYFGENNEIAPSISAVEKNHSVDLVKIGMRFVLLSAVTSVALNIDNLLILNYKGPSSVAEYSVPAKLASLVGLMITVMFLPLWPAFGEALAKNEVGWVRRYIYKSSVIGSMLVLSVGLVVAFASGLIIKHWMGVEIKDAGLIVIAFVGMYFSMAISSPCQVALNSMGIVSPQVAVFSIYLIATVLLKIMFIQQQPLWILPAINTFSYMIVVFPAILWIVLKELGKRGGDVA